MRKLDIAELAGEFNTRDAAEEQIPGNHIRRQDTGNRFETSDIRMLDIRQEKQSIHLRLQAADLLQPPAAPPRHKSALPGIPTIIVSHDGPYPLSPDLTPGTCSRTGLTGLFHGGSVCSF